MKNWRKRLKKILRGLDGGFKMVKRLNSLGKLLYIFTALFPLYIYGLYFLILKSLANFSYVYLFFIALLGIFIVLSPSIFFGDLVTKGKKHDKEIFVKSCQKNSKHLVYIISSLSPFLLFIIEIWRDTNYYDSAVLITSIMFVLVGFVLVFKDEEGILYNLFFIRYNVLTIKDKQDNEKMILSNKDSLSGYIKVNQLNRKVFKEWN